MVCGTLAFTSHREDEWIKKKMGKECTASIKELLKSDRVMFTHMSHWLAPSHVAIPSHVGIRSSTQPDPATPGLLRESLLSTKGSCSLSLVSSCCWNVAARPATWKWPLDCDQRCSGSFQAKVQQQLYPVHTQRPDVADGGATRWKNPGSLHCCFEERLLLIRNSHFRSECLLCFGT